MEDAEDEEDADEEEDADDEDYNDHNNLLPEPPVARVIPVSSFGEFFRKTPAPNCWVVRVIRASLGSH